MSAGRSACARRRSPSYGTTASTRHPLGRGGESSTSATTGVLDDRWPPSEGASRPARRPRRPDRLPIYLAAHQRARPELTASAWSVFILRANDRSAASPGIAQPGCPTRRSDGTGGATCTTSRTASTAARSSAWSIRSAPGSCRGTDPLTGGARRSPADPRQVLEAPGGWARTRARRHPRRQLDRARRGSVARREPQGSAARPASQGAVDVGHACGEVGGARHAGAAPPGGASRAGASRIRRVRGRVRRGQPGLARARVGAPLAAIRYLPAVPVPERLARARAAGGVVVSGSGSSPSPARWRLWRDRHSSTCHCPSPPRCAQRRRSASAPALPRSWRWRWDGTGCGLPASRSRTGSWW